MTIPPILRRGHSFFKPVNPSESVKGKADILHEAIDQTAKEVLPPQTVPSKTEIEGGWWTWLWGTKKQETVKVQEEVEELEEKNVPLQVGDESFLSQAESEELSSDEEDDYDLNESTDENISEESAEQKEQVEETLVKTYQAAQATRWQRLKGGVGNLAAWAAAPGIRAYASRYKGKVDKEKSITEAKKQMLNQIPDPQFVEFYDVTKAVISPAIQNLLDSFKGSTDVAATQYILPNRDLIIDLLEINLARGFVNLARQVRQHQAQIPNYDKQPALVNILSLLSQKAGAHIDAKQLSDLEEKYQDARRDLLNQTQQLFPGIDQQPDMEETIQKYIKEYIKSTDANRKNVIKHNLFPNLNHVDDQKAEDIQSFFATLDTLHTRDREFHQLFNRISDDILLYFFPNKFADMEAPGLLQYGWIQDRIYETFIRDPFTNFLQESFESLENDSVRNKAWEDELQAKVGAPDMKTLIQAPSSLLTAFAKNYIQADPKAMQLVSQSIDALIHPTPTDKVKNSLKNQTSKDLLNQLSQEQLANWIIESAQAILNTQDPNLEGLGRFIKQGVNNLALALMAKGATLVIPEKKEIEPNEFIKEFSDHLVGKISSLKDEEMTPQFWKDFVKDLPLPTFVKDLLVPHLIGHAQSLQEQLNSPDLQEMQNIHAEVENKIRNYKGGEQLLSITEKISDQIIEQVLEQNIGLVTTLGLGDTIEELFAQYLPEVTINDDLKTWFKDNMSALEVTEEGKSPQSIALLKQGIQAVLRRAMVDTIEKNFKDDSQDYAAQLLKNFQQAFQKAFVGFDAKQREKIDQALQIQANIEKKNNDIVEIKKKIGKKPDGLEAAQTSLTEEVLKANIRYIRASNYVESLIEKRDVLLEKLNEGYENAPWKAEQLPLVSEALVLHNMEAPKYATQNDFIQELEGNIEEYQAIANDRKLTDAEEKDLAQHQLLIDLLKMPVSELKLVSDALHTHLTLQHAKKELGYLKGELDTKKHAVANLEQDQIKDTKAWEDAKEWMNQVLQSRQEINRLSKEIGDLQNELDDHLAVFQLLSEELTGLLGLEKEKLDLPPYLQETVWPYIQSAKKSQMARFLFAQISPLLISLSDIQKNKDQLTQIAKGDPFLGQLIHASAEDAISRLSDFVTSYKPFAKQILIMMGEAQPTEEEIGRMETALNQTLIELGKEGIVASMLKPLVKSLVSEKAEDTLSKSLAAEEEALSQSLEGLISQAEEIEISKEDILDLLKAKVRTANKKEEKKLQQHAQTLAKNVNHLLLNRGKTKLKPVDLLEAYQGQVEGNQKAIPADKKEGVLQALKNEGVVDKIKAVVMTPEEIAQALNDSIPGATDLHTLIAPQLQAVLVGDDPTFKENRDVLQRFLEGTLLRLFVKIAEVNQGQDVLTVVTQKLKDLAQKVEPVAGQKTEEVARQMIDQVLDEVLGIASMQDLDSIPPALRKLAYDKIKEQAYQQLTPLILPIIERGQSRTELKDLSGSNFLANLCQALSKDVFILLPFSVKSYRPIAEELFKLLSVPDYQPTAAEIDDFAKEIATLVKDKNLKNSSLVKAYAKVAKQPLESINQEELKAKLEERKVKDEINNILMTPEDIAAAIGKGVPHLDAKLQQALADELQAVLHTGSAVYQNVSDFAGAYIEGVLLKVFIGVAKKNPKQASKDTLIVLTEKLLDVAAKKYQEMKGGKTVEDVTEELDDAIMKDILGIDSPAAFEGLPDALKIIAYDAIKDQLGGLLLRIHQSLSTVKGSNTQVQAAKDKVKKYGIAEEATKGYVQILAEDLSNMVMSSIPNVLTEISGEKMKGVIQVSQGIESYLEDLSRGNLEMAKVLLKYTKADQFQKMLGDNLDKLAAKDQLADDKQQAADLLSNLLLEPLSQVIEKTIQFENDKGAQFNQQLMANFLKLGAGHLKNLNAAKQLAAKDGQPVIRHQDFVAAVGDELHPGVPKEPIAYQKSIEIIEERLYRKLDLEQQKASQKVYGRLTLEQAKKWEQEKGNVRQLMARMIQMEGHGTKVLTLDDFIEKFGDIHLTVTGQELTQAQKRSLKASDDKGFTLRDVIRQESEAPNSQRQQEAYGPASKQIMNMLFPNKENDLTFVPEELRRTVWKAFKKKLFPVVLPMLTEMILDPALINNIVLNSLTATRNNLEESIRDIQSGKIVEETNHEPADRLLDDLDGAAGELIFEVLNATTLPSWLKKLLLDSEQKGTSDAMKRTLGASLRQQFNETFIQDKLKLALEQVVQRINPETGEVDAAGKPVLSVDTRPREIKRQEAVKKAQQVRADLKKVSREVVNLSISYYISSTWAAAQKRFDDLVEKIFGKVALKVKLALDKVFGFIFFRIIGTIVSVIFWPVKQLVKEMIYSVISLDKNRDALLSMLTEVPFDQPLTGTNTNSYPVYNEDLIFKMGKALNETVQEFLKKPVLPVATDKEEAVTK